MCCAISFRIAMIALSGNGSSGDFHWRWTACPAMIDQGQNTSEIDSWLRQGQQQRSLKWNPPGASTSTLTGSTKSPSRPPSPPAPPPPTLSHSWPGTATNPTQSAPPGARRQRSPGTQGQEEVEGELLGPEARRENQPGQGTRSDAEGHSCHRLPTCTTA